MNKKLDISTIAKIGILSTIATVLMLFEIPLWFAPPFYEIDLSEVVVLIGGFALGPVAAIFIELIKIFLNFLLNGTVTAGIGEAANFLIGLSFVLPAVYIYRHKKSMKTAIIGMSVGTVSMAVIGGLVNLYLILPMFANIYGMPIGALVEMGSKLNGSITDIYTFVLLATTPFNILRGILSSVITLLLYKKLSSILHK